MNIAHRLRHQVFQSERETTVVSFLIVFTLEKHLNNSEQPEEFLTLVGFLDEAAYRAPDHAHHRCR